MHREKEFLNRARLIIGMRPFDRAVLEVKDFLAEHHPIVRQKPCTVRHLVGIHQSFERDEPAQLTIRRTVFGVKMFVEKFYQHAA